MWRELLRSKYAIEGCVFLRSLFYNFIILRKDDIIWGFPTKFITMNPESFWQQLQSVGYGRVCPWVFVSHFARSIVFSKEERFLCRLKSKSCLNTNIDDALVYFVQSPLWSVAMNILFQEIAIISYGCQEPGRYSKTRLCHCQLQLHQEIKLPIFCLRNQFLTTCMTLWIPLSTALRPGLCWQEGFWSSTPQLFADKSLTGLSFGGVFYFSVWDYESLPYGYAPP